MALEHSSSPQHAVDFEAVGTSYFQERELKKGAAGWVLLVGLGVAYVISGDYAGWNFGLAQGGWGGLFIATLLMATMYLCMCFSLAELSSMVPTAGGGYGFARTAFGLPIGRLSHRHGDPHRIRHRAGRHRGIHRRLLRVVIRHRRLDDLPGVLHHLYWHPYLWRR